MESATLNKLAVADDPRQASISPAVLEFVQVIVHEVTVSDFSTLKMQIEDTITCAASGESSSVSLSSIMRTFRANPTLRSAWVKLVSADASHLGPE
jgi:hypothetical protein